MATQPAESQLGLKESFYRRFQQEVATLKEEIERLNSIAAAGGERNNAIDNCLAGIDRLTHEVQDASSYIPAYDQRAYSQKIKELSEQLQQTRNSFNPPKKFSFKTRKTASASSTSGSAGQTPNSGVPAVASRASGANSSVEPTLQDKFSTVQQSSQQEATQSIESDNLGDIDTIAKIQRPTFPNATKIIIANRTNLHIQPPASASYATGSGTISSVEKCTINLSAPTKTAPFSALYLKDIKNSLIITGRVAGAIHITSVENTVLVTTCRQFRMHSSKNVDIYLHSASRPIIEDCKDVRFAPLPRELEDVELTQAVNRWDQIDDFKWLKAGPSPNFGILPEDGRVSGDVWRMVSGDDEDLGVEEILAAVKVQI